MLHGIRRPVGSTSDRNTTKYPTQRVGGCATFRWGVLQITYPFQFAIVVRIDWSVPVRFYYGGKSEVLDG